MSRSDIASTQRIGNMQARRQVGMGQARLVFITALLMTVSATGLSGLQGVMILTSETRTLAA